MLFGYFSNENTIIVGFTEDFRLAVRRAEYLNVLAPHKRSMCAIMRGIVTDTPVHSIVNMPNRGQIGNLPLDAVVETMSTITKDGIEPEFSSDMPGAIGSLCRLHLDVIDMVVRAALTGDRKLLIGAMMLDPFSANADFEDIPKLCD